MSAVQTTEILLQSPSQLPWIRGDGAAGCWEGMWLCPVKTKNRAWGPLLLGVGAGAGQRLLTGPEVESSSLCRNRLYPQDSEASKCPRWGIPEPVGCKAEQGECTHLATLWILAHGGI